MRKRGIEFVFLLFLPGAACFALTVEDIDRQVGLAWTNLNVSPAETCTDAEFLRRAYLDLVGQTPSLEQTLSFLNSKVADKRSDLIDALLESPEYGERRATVWQNLMKEGRVLRRQFPIDSFHAPLAEAFQKDMPFDEFVRALISAEGSSKDNPFTYLVLTHEAKPEDLTSTTARLFLGTQLQCAQCHDDKIGPWKQNDFWGFAAFYSRVGAQPEQKGKGRPESYLVAERRRGEAIIPEGGTPVSFQGLPKEERQMARRELEMEMRANPVAPAYLGEIIRQSEEESRRATLARILTTQDGLFPRAVVNRVWAELFGAGLIDPVDNIHGKTAGDFEPVLRELADHFTRSDYSLKELYRVLMNTRAYHLSSKGTEDSVTLRTAFAQARLRPIGPEVLLESLLATTNLEEVPKNRAGEEAFQRNKRRVLEKFVFAFGNDEGESSTAFEGTIPQALMMMNDEIMARAVMPQPGSTFHNVLRSGDDAGDRVRMLYLAVLCREPSDEELSECMQYIKDTGPSDGPVLAEPVNLGRKRRGAGRPQQAQMAQAAEPYQDIYWALLNTSEYLYNH